MIQTSISPNTTKSDILLCLKYLLPWNWLKWKKGSSIAELEGQFSRTVNRIHAVSFFRGAQALFAILQSLDIKHGDEVIIQAYTCFVVPNAIQFTGATPVFCDVEPGTLNISPEDIRLKLNKHTKAIIVQHTFGNPAKISEIKKICQENNIYLIEDCAQNIGSTYAGQLLGTFGDAALWSFGRDKVISGVWGGMATTNNQEIAAKLRLVQRESSSVTYWSILQSILHPIVFSIAKPLYHRRNIGKAIVKLCQTLGLIPMVTQQQEKDGKPPVPHPSKMSNFCAALALNQLSQLDRSNAHRQKITTIYRTELSSNPNITLPKQLPESAPVYLRYTILVKNAPQLIETCRKQNIQLGDWSNTVIAPKGLKYENFQYKNNCPVAEKEGKMAVNLPTHIQLSEADARKICGIIKNLS